MRFLLLGPREIALGALPHVKDQVFRWASSSLRLRTSSLLPCPVAMETPGLESEAWETKTQAP